ncbi:MAG: helix-turn-helix transcriptional regulator [Oscillospiraceae bacterium]|nr:helix-turn-helix transcriptional regulator [Oscillospiraceae bacterium]
MIQTLNLRDFEAFGTGFLEKSQLSGLANSHSVALSPSDSTLYETVAETWLAEESGIPILSVSTQDGTMLDFYLDRTVRLKPGVRFCLSAMGGKANVQMAGYSLPRLLQTQVANRFEMRPKLRITRLCALRYQQKEPGYLFPGEAHQLMELTYVDEGSLHSVADGRDLQLEQGDMVIYDKNQWHMQHAAKNIAPKLVVIAFDAEGYDLSGLINRRFPSSAKTVSILQQMLREQERIDEYGEDVLINLMQQLLLTLLRESTETARQEQTGQFLNSENQIIRQVQQYIAAHVTEKLTVPAIAQAAQVSASYLTALFHRHLQISPGEYVRRIKLEKSKQMIRQGQMNFTQIAESLQYSTIYHFSRQFKQTFGMTPSEYMRSVR